MRKSIFAVNGLFFLFSSIGCVHAACPSIGAAQIQDLSNSSSNNAGLVIAGKKWGAQLRKQQAFNPATVVAQKVNESPDGQHCTFNLFDNTTRKVTGTIQLHQIK